MAEGDLAVKIAQMGQLVMFPGPVLEILPSLPTLYQGPSVPGLSRTAIGAPVSWTCLFSERQGPALPAPEECASLGPSRAGRWVSLLVAERVRLSQGGPLFSFSDIETTVFSGGLGVTGRR